MLIGDTTSDARATKKVLRQLEQQGHRGKIAAQLFRCQKASARAILSSRSTNSQRHKAKSLEKLCHRLVQDDCGLKWGWKDARSDSTKNLICIDLPNGQVSFHSVRRLAGPDYLGGWDGTHFSESRIIGWCWRQLA